MAKANTTVNVRHILLRISRVHFFYAIAYGVTIVIFDSWNLISHQSVIQRWEAVSILLVINALVWYACRLKLKNDFYYKLLTLILLLADIVFAASNVFWQRGVASKAVMLFAVPIICAGLARSRSLLMLITSISAVAYSLVAVTYFNQNYGQGYRVELYGEVFFYSAMFFIMAFLMMVSFKPAKD